MESWRIRTAQELFCKPEKYSISYYRGYKQRDDRFYSVGRNNRPAFYPAGFEAEMILQIALAVMLSVVGKTGDAWIDYKPMIKAIHPTITEARIMEILDAVQNYSEDSNAEYKDFGQSVSQPVLLALIQQEADFRNLKHHKDMSIGMCGIKIETAKDMCTALGIQVVKPDTIENLLWQSPTFNIRIASGYLCFLLRYYKGNLPHAISAYNCGLNRFDRCLKKYGKKYHTKYYDRWKRKYDKFEKGG